MHPLRRCLSGLAALGLTLTTIGGCNVFRSASDCSRDLDCPRGVGCNAAGYCELGAPIRVGVLLPLTGNQATAPLGETRLEGIRFGLWLLERGNQGRLLGRGVELLIEDSLSDASQVERLTNGLIDRNIAVLLGPVTSADAIVAQKLTFSTHLLHVAPQASAEAVGSAQASGTNHRYLFQGAARSGEAMGALLNLLADPSRPKRFDACFRGVTVLYRDDATGNAQNAALQDVFPRNCLPIVQSIAVPVERKASYAEEVEAVLAARADGHPVTCMVVCTRSDVAGAFLRELRTAESERELPADQRIGALLGGSPLGDQTFVEQARPADPSAPSLAEGFYFGGIDAEAQTPERRQLDALYEEYKAASGTKIEMIDLLVGWSQMTLLVGLALEANGGATDPVALRDAFVDVATAAPGDVTIGPADIASALARIRARRASGERPGVDFQGAYSSMEFDPEGFVPMGAILARIENGKYEDYRHISEADNRAIITADPGPACAVAPK